MLTWYEDQGNKGDAGDGGRLSSWSRSKRLSIFVGLTLHYRSKRRGFVYYTMGQIREVARFFYHKDLTIELVREEILFDTVHVTFQLTFDNRAFTLASLAMTREEKHLPIGASVLFEIFPFCIVFG